MLWSVIIYGLATLVAAFVAALAGLPSLFATPAPGTLWLTIIIGAGIAALVVLGGRYLERHEWYARMGEVLREPVRQLLGPRAGAAEQFIVAASSSIGEETLFRGLCQPGLARLLVKHASFEPRVAIGVAIVTTAFSFMILHPPWKKELRPWTFFAFVMGVSWGALAQWSGSLVGPVLSHFLVNFFNLRRLLAWPGVARDSRRC